jgi:threonine synthase
MKAKTVQQCIIPGCGETYDVHTLRTTCGSCGNLVDVRYAGSPSPALKEVFDERRNHRGNIFNESGVWRFRELINFPGVDCDDYDAYSNVLVSLDGAEGRTKPFHLTRVAEYVGMRSENFWLQFEGDNPTGSFKDNGMATAFTHAKMLGVKRVACASTGNTASSAASFAANEGIEAVVFMGEGKIVIGKLAQTLDYGARVIQIRGDFDDAMNWVKELVTRKGLYVVNSLSAFRLEGQKTMMYRVLAYLNWRVPDWIVFPGGNLGNTSAFGKAFKELYDWGWIKKMPRMAVVNAEGANTLYRLFNEMDLRWNGGRVDDEVIDSYYMDLEQRGQKAETKASAIEILKPVNLKKALRTMEYTDGVVVQVSDEEMLDARAIVGRNGFGCELASAATIVGIKQLVSEERIQQDETVVGILTGHMLKDPDTIIKYHLTPGNTFSNTPHVVANDLQSILAIL